MEALGVRITLTQPKFPEELYRRLPTTAEEAKESAALYAGLLFQSLHDPELASKIQETLYHIQYRCIKLKVYEESEELKLVQYYEQTLPYMVWPRKKNNRREELKKKLLFSTICTHQLFPPIPLPWYSFCTSEDKDEDRNQQPMQPQPSFRKRTRRGKGSQRRSLLRYKAKLLLHHQRRKVDRLKQSRDDSKESSIKDQVSKNFQPHSPLYQYDGTSPNKETLPHVDGLKLILLDKRVMALSLLTCLAGRTYHQSDGRLIPPSILTQA